jgi:predicted MPP superfamily phosphohydrolase
MGLMSSSESQRKPPAVRLRSFAGHLDHVEQLDLRIAHLTDLHVGRVTPERIQHAAVDLTNSQRPDLVVITGDFVCHGQTYLDQLTDVVARFDAPVLTVLGNHDYWSGATEVERALRRGGAEVLKNAHTSITLRHQRLQVVGLDDAYTGNAARDRAVKGLRTDLPVIGLSHIAEEADGLWAANVPLVFSGHTHGGQVTVARLHELMIGRVGGHRYVHGLYGCREGRHHAGAVYVGAGIGASVVPFRLGDRGQREIAIFELGKEPGSIQEHHVEQPPLPGRAPSPRKQLARAVAVVKKEQQRERRHRRKARRD